MSTLGDENNKKFLDIQEYSSDIVENQKRFKSIWKIEEEGVREDEKIVKKWLEENFKGENWNLVGDEEREVEFEKEVICLIGYLEFIGKKKNSFCVSPLYLQCNWVNQVIFFFFFFFFFFF